MSSPEAPTPVKTTRRTPEGSRAPWSTELKHAFLQKPFWIPHGSRLPIGTCRMATAKDVGSRVKCRWGPRVRTEPYDKYQTKKGSATLP
jgi:hypothetical protein